MLSLHPLNGRNNYSKIKNNGGNIIHQSAQVRAVYEKFIKEELHPAVDNLTRWYGIQTSNSQALMQVYRNSMTISKCDDTEMADGENLLDLATFCVKEPLSKQGCENPTPNVDNSNCTRLDPISSSNLKAYSQISDWGRSQKFKNLNFLHYYFKLTIKISVWFDIFNNVYACTD